MTQHSLEPWARRPLPDGCEFDGYERICDRDGVIIGTVRVSTLPGNKPTGPGIDNARRIVACVNACGDLPTEYLERLVLERLVQGSADSAANTARGECET